MDWLRYAVSPLDGVRVRVTTPVNPFWPVTVTVEVPLPPLFIVSIGPTVLGLALTMKPGGRAPYCPPVSDAMMSRPLVSKR